MRPLPLQHFWLHQWYVDVLRAYQSNVFTRVSSDNRVSAATVSLIRNLLVLDPKARLTASQVLDQLCFVIRNWSVSVTSVSVQCPLQNNWMSIQINNSSIPSSVSTNQRITCLKICDRRCITMQSPVLWVPAENLSWYSVFHIFHELPSAINS